MVQSLRKQGQVSRSGSTYVGVDHAVIAIVLIAVLAALALHTAADLGADADALADLELLDVLANPGHYPDDLVANDERERASAAPSLAEGMHVRAADTAVRDSKLDVVIREILRLERHDVERAPRGGV